MRAIVPTLTAVALLGLPLVTGVLRAEEELGPKDELRKKYAEKERVLSWDGTYYADLKKLADSRWKIPQKPPFRDLSHEKGVQMYGTFAPRADLPNVIEVLVYKSLMILDGGTKKSYWEFKNIRKKVDTTDWKGVHEARYEDWIAGATEVETKKCVKPRRSAVGPSELYASVQGKFPKEEGGRKVRMRRDWYTWNANNEMWFAEVTFDETILGSEATLDRGKEFVKALCTTAKRDSEKMKE